jgi:hypothetical protein
MRGSEVSIYLLNRSWVKCGEVQRSVQCSDGLSNMVSNVIGRHRQYEVAAYMYFTIITFFHIP